jgi:hypothetical protein
MSSAFPVVRLLLPAALVLLGPHAAAQQQSRSATVSVSVRVLPQASFEGGTEHRFSADLVPGEALHVDPADGVRTRMTYNAATRVVVSGTPLRGPGGATIEVRFVCAFGGGMTVSAAEPFDCVAGLLAELEGASTTRIPLAIGAELSAGETVGMPPGLYTGLVTLTATHPAY